MKHHSLTDRNLVEDWSEHWEQLVYLVSGVICLNHPISADNELNYSALRSWFQNHQDGFTPVWQEFLNSHYQYLYCCILNEGPKPRLDASHSYSPANIEERRDVVWSTLRPYEAAGNRPPWLVAERRYVQLTAPSSSFLDSFDSKVPLTHNPFHYFLKPERLLEVVQLMCTATEPGMCHDCWRKGICDGSVFTALLNSWSLTNCLARWIADRAV